MISKRYFLVLFLALAGMTAKGQTVIMNGDYYLTHNDTGTTVSTTAATGFNPNTCIWNINDRRIRTADSNGSVFDLTNNYLQTGSVSLGNSVQWRTAANGGNLEATRNNYLNRNNTTWRISNNNSRATAYAVTITSGQATSTPPTISGADVLTTTGNSNYTASGAAFQIGYTNYRFNNANLYFDENGNSFTGTPAGATISGYSWELSSEEYATVSGTNGTGTVNVTSLPQNDVTVTLTVTASFTGGTPAVPSGTSLTGNKTITLQGTYPSAPTISVSGTTVTLSTTAAGTTSIRYTLDGTDPTATTGTVYNGTPIDLSGSTTSPVTIKAVTVRNGNASNVVEQSVMMTLPEPVITTNPEAGTATISCSITGTTIYYTLDGSEPTTSSSQYSGNLTGLNLMTTIKAIAVKEGWNNSTVASATLTIPSGVSGGVVTLFDYEDHSWSYYSDASTPSELHSLNPADVKITYYGDGIMMTGDADYTASSTDYITSTHTDYKVGAKVNVGGENENTFVYYKTLERENADGSGRCPYKPIPNPFQVRPRYKDRDVDANDFTGWRGFQCWRLKSVTGGAVYAGASGGTALSTGAVINAETEIYFAPNAEYGMEVQFEAVWARAYVKKANQANENPVGTNNVGYERNFCVPTTGAGYTLYTGNGKRITNTNNVPVTISCYYPDGTAPDNTNNSISNTATSLTGDTKFENIPINLTTNTLTLANYDIIIGRGCGTSTINLLQGVSGTYNGDLDYTMRIECGTINQLAFVRDGGTNSTYSVSGTVMVKAILGCDYDRATNTNTNLSVSQGNTLFYARAGAFTSSQNKDKKVFDCVVKSGEYQKDYWDTDANPNGTTGTGGFNYVHSMYCGHNFNQTTNNHYPGSRYVTIEGGQLGNINGGRGTGADGNNDNPDATTNQTDAWKIAFSLRIKKDAVINGCVFGGAANTSAWGSKRIVLTGGKVYSWIAGGANGTNTTNGDSRTRGASYIYVGGNTEVGGPNAKMKNSTLGGQVFGAGRGFTNQAASMDTSYVVIADNAKIMKKDNDASGNVYGGGNIGYIHKQSNIYILGGTIEGGVYGGAFNNGLAIPEVNITMKGGLVEGGVYGGSNNNGTISGNVTMHIDGGQVGTESANANVHGGGYGQPTRVNGNVELNLGTCNATTGVTVFGDVYGGSAMGVVNTNNNNTTTVSLYKGTIYGGLYGGGYGPGGEDADVNGKVYVKVYGGSVLCSAADPDGEAGTGSVFGCNNISGTPKSTVNVDIYSTDQPASGYALHAVYGGGNKAPYTQVPVVTVHGCNNSIEYVYGGGNATDVRGTDVTIWGGTIGNAFGGGNGFSETGNHNDPNALHYNPGANITYDGTNLKIYGGEIISAFGGSNQYGRINSTINVTVDTKTEPGSDPCSGVAYEECDLVIDELYGGGNEAPIQTSGNVWITPTVQVLACDAYIKNFFGGAKKADYGGNIVTNIVAGRFDNVFGGNNKGGIIEGDVTLNLKGGTIGNAFGGCNEDGNITGSITVNVIDGELECPLYITNVYGGGQDAAYTPNDPTIISPKVNISHKKQGTSVTGSVFGGGKGADAVVTANPYVTVGDNDNNHYSIVSGEVYGGGNAAAVVGSTEVLIKNRAKVIGNIYGGGNMGAVSGNTKVIINGRTN